MDINLELFIKTDWPFSVVCLKTRGEVVNNLDINKTQHINSLMDHVVTIYLFSPDWFGPDSDYQRHSLRPIWTCRNTWVIDQRCGVISIQPPDEHQCLMVISSDTRGRITVFLGGGSEEKCSDQREDVIQLLAQRSAPHWSQTQQSVFPWACLGTRHWLAQPESRFKPLKAAALIFCDVM